MSAIPFLAWLFLLTFVGDEPEVQQDIWTSKIPEYVCSHGNNGYYSSEDELQPPAVPRQLEKPFLNQNHIQKDDQSVLPNPAFVYLPKQSELTRRLC